MNYAADHSSEKSSAALRIISFSHAETKVTYQNYGRLTLSIGAILELMGILATDVCICIYEIIALNINSQGICGDGRKVNRMLEFCVNERTFSKHLTSDFYYSYLTRETLLK